MKNIRKMLIYTVSGAACFVATSCVSVKKMQYLADKAATEAVSLSISERENLPSVSYMNIRNTNNVTVPHTIDKDDISTYHRFNPSSRKFTAAGVVVMPEQVPLYPEKTIEMSKGFGMDVNGNVVVGVAYKTKLFGGKNSVEVHAARLSVYKNETAELLKNNFKINVNDLIVTPKDTVVPTDTIKAASTFLRPSEFK